MENLIRLLLSEYGLSDPRLELLEGYDDKTYRVADGEARYILKCQNVRKLLPDRFRLEARLVKKLHATTSFDFPVPVPTLKGKTYLKANGQYIRLLTYLEGEFLAKVPQPEALMESLGKLLGQMDLVGSGLEAGSLAGTVFRWDLQHLGMHRDNIGLVADPHDRALIYYYFLHFEAEVSPIQHRLKKALIHNDANDWNVLTREGRVSGIIDFGDMAYTWRINELAVALTYVLPGKDDPLQAASTVIRAYHRHCPLDAEELGVLYYLIGGRMAMSLCNSALAKKQQPDSDYISISEAPVRELLRKWISIAPEAARKAFLEAAGLPAPKASHPETYLARRREYFPDSLSLSYRNPILMQRAAFQYMFNHKGETFLDAYNNIMLVGHAHPRVVEATSRTLRRLNTNTRYLYDELLDYAERLLQYFPPPLTKIMLVNSGSAATDLALRLARTYTGRRKVMVLEQGYHGNTLAGIAVSPYKHRHGDSFPETLVCPMPKVFGSGLKDDGEAGRFFSRQGIRHLEKHPGGIAALIAEPIMGCGGQVPLPSGYLPVLYDRVRAQGGLCISDEVQVGFGRLGKWNWGFEKYGVVPDLVVLGKPIGNGHPIGAVVTTEAIASCFDSGPEFFSSFGGNPVSCAAGLAVLNVLEEEGLKEHARETGTYLMDGFRNLQARYPCIADVRGEGLFIGVELQDRLGNPGTALAGSLKNQLREAHILVGTDGPDENVLKIKPPLPFNRENSDCLLTETARILDRLKES
jgi:4-aminobutyrate aminotransferase-like enzyme/aminoglycoside phosphotransferase (APT) family kinase protein